MTALKAEVEQLLVQILVEVQMKALKAEVEQLQLVVQILVEVQMRALKTEVEQLRSGELRAALQILVEVAKIQMRT